MKEDPINNPVPTRKHPFKDYVNSILESPLLEATGACCGIIVATIVITIIWSLIFRFDIPWPGGSEYGDYPFWTIGLYSISHEPLTKHDWGLYFPIEIIYSIYAPSQLIKFVLSRTALLYLLPFTIASIALCFFKRKRSRIIFSSIMALIILCLQLLFGHTVFNTWQTLYPDSTIGTESQYIFLYGGASVILALAYSFTIHISHRNIQNWHQPINHLKTLLLAHLIAFIVICITLGIICMSFIGIILGIIVILLLLIAITILVAISKLIRIVRHSS